MLYEAGMYETSCFVTSTEHTLAYYYPEAIIPLVTKLKRIGREDTSWMWGMEKQKLRCAQFLKRLSEENKR